MKRQLPDAVTSQLDVRLVVPGDAGVPLPVTLRYDPADPYAVYATFRTPDGTVEWVFARELLSDRVRGALAGYRSALESAAAELSAAVADGDAPLVPDPVLTGARNSIGHRLDRLERRVVAASKRRHDQLVRDVETARASLFPLGRPQERMLTLMPMLARHGEALLEAMLERAREHAASLVEGTLVSTGRAIER